MSRVRTSTINFGHFLNDLIGMYDCSVDETVLVELVANSLDARSSRIAIDVDREKQTFSITDNGEIPGFPGWMVTPLLSTPLIPRIVAQSERNTWTAIT